MAPAVPAVPQRSQESFENNALVMLMPGNGLRIEVQDSRAGNSQL